ncbi:MAG: hypothetical protein V1809_01255 [Planctomycetota bacterium]
MTTEQRLENLERQLACVKRFNRWLLVAVGVAVGGWWLLGAGGLRHGLSTAQAAEGGGKEEKIVRANGFVLEDINGNTRASMTLDKEGGPSMILFDGAGKAGAIIAMIQNEPSICLYGNNSKSGILLNVDKFGSSINLSDEKGNIRVDLAVTKYGPALNLSDEKGVRREMLGVDKNQPFLYFRDENQKERVVLIVTKEGPELILNDENGKSIWSAPAKK